jgi:hypothetical protein
MATKNPKSLLLKMSLCNSSLDNQTTLIEKCGSGAARRWVNISDSGIAADDKDYWSHHERAGDPLDSSA